MRDEHEHEHEHEGVLDWWLSRCRASANLTATPQAALAED